MLPLAAVVAPTLTASEGSLLLEADETPPSSWSSSSTIAETGTGVNPMPRPPEPDEMALLLLEGEAVFIALGSVVSVASGDAVGFAIVGLTDCAV